MYYVDSHIHLADNYYNEYLEIIFDIIRYTKIQSFCMSEDLISSIATVSLKEKYFKESDLLNAFVGIHPQFASSSNSVDLFYSFFHSNLRSIAGIGEIGLDPTYSLLDRSNTSERQEFVFRKMLTLAENKNKPISLHSRRSVNEILEILPSYRIKKAVFHWYDGNKKNLKIINDRGYFVSFGPYVMYTHDKQSLLKQSDINLLLVETDGPVTYKYCFDDAVITSPSMVISIINFISILLKKSFSELSEILYTNSKKFMN